MNSDFQEPVTAECECGFFFLFYNKMRFRRVPISDGGSKFSRVGVFSGLNNLEDLTMQSQTADLVGWTHEEPSTRYSNWKKPCFSSSSS